jgi:hypothetical protein
MIQGGDFTKGDGKANRHYSFLRRTCQPAFPLSRHWRPIHLRREVRRRELQAQALWRRMAVHGERRQRHERISIFHHHQEDLLAGRKARCVWEDYQGKNATRQVAQN